MANISFSLNRGQTAFSVVEGTDAPATGDLEVSINLAQFPTNSGTPINNEIQVLLEAVKEWISGRSELVA